MKTIFITLVALWAAFYYTHSINRMVREYDKKAKGISFAFATGITLFTAGISFLAVTISGTTGLIISGIMLGVLGIFQFFLRDPHQFRGVTALAVPFALAAGYSKAGRFDALKVFTQGFSVIKSLFWTFVIGIVFVALCGLVRWLIVGGYFSRLAAWIKGKNTDDEDEDDDESDDEEEITSGLAAWLTPQVITTVAVAAIAIVVVVILLV